MHNKLQDTFVSTSYILKQVKWMIPRLLSALKIIWVYDPRAVLLSSKTSNPFTPLGLCGISTSSVIIFRLQKLNSLGYICPRTKRSLKRHLSSADQRQHESILLCKQWRTHKRSLQWGSGMLCTAAIHSVQSDTLQVGGRCQINWIH